MIVFLSLVIAISILFAVTLADGALADDTDFKMIPIDPDVDYQNIDSINIDLSSDGGSVTNAMFNIVPSNDGCGVTVETSPPNLVNVRIDVYGALSFEWKTDVSSTASSGTVRIGVPPDQLQEVSVFGGNSVQVLDGFTHIIGLSVSDDGSILRASMMSLISSISTYFDLYNYKGQMYVETNVPVDYSWITEGGQSWIETPSLNGIAVEDNGSQLNIKGDVDAKNEADVTIGSLGDRVVAGAQLTVTGTITGSIYNRDGSIVNTQSCDNVISDDFSTCNVGPQSVDVDIGDLSQNNQILYGTYTCGGEDSSPSFLAPSDSAVDSIDIVSVDATDIITDSSSSSSTNVYLIVTFTTTATTMLI